MLSPWPRQPFAVFFFERAIHGPAARGSNMRKSLATRSTAPAPARLPAAPPDVATRPAGPAGWRSRESIPGTRRLSLCGPRAASASAAVSHSSSLCLVTKTRSIERVIASMESKAWCSRKIRLHSVIALPSAKARLVSRKPTHRQGSANPAARAAGRTENHNRRAAEEHQRSPRPSNTLGFPAAQNQPPSSRRRMPGSSILRRRLSRIFHREIERNRVGHERPAEIRDAAAISSARSASRRAPSGACAGYKR